MSESEGREQPYVAPRADFLSAEAARLKDPAHEDHGKLFVCLFFDRHSGPIDRLALSPEDAADLHEELGGCLDYIAGSQP